MTKDPNRFFARFDGRIVTRDDVAHWLYGPTPTERQKDHGAALAEKWRKDGHLNFVRRANQDRDPIYRVKAPKKPVDPIDATTLAPPKSQRPKIDPVTFRARMAKALGNALCAGPDVYEAAYAEHHAALCKAEGKRGVLPKNKDDALYVTAMGYAYRLGTFKVADLAEKLGPEGMNPRLAIARLCQSKKIRNVEKPHKGKVAVYEWIGREPDGVAAE